MGGPRWGMTSDDRADQNRDILPVVPNLAVRTGPQPDDQPAEQGDAPAGAAERPTSGAPLPSGERLGGAEVTALVGGGEGATQTTRALEAAEGLNPDTES